MKNERKGQKDQATYEIVKLCEDRERNKERDVNKGGLKDKGKL